MNTGTYSIIDFLRYPGLSQLVIPEIQRDYVWDSDNVLDLLQTIKEGFLNPHFDAPYLGFIYAYTDKDFAYKYFLVDGQQRMTTIFLLLLAAYHKRGKKLPDYLMKEGRPKVDYKVRNATHDFLCQLVRCCESTVFDSACDLKDQIWYHKEYETDRTIQNIINNFQTIKDWLGDFKDEEVTAFTSFVEKKVTVSYFNIDSGRQGEDLYIYMNSRGRELVANETLKANFLSQLKESNEKKEWGHKWENWQDFFWKHREVLNVSDADAGYNEFLKLLQIVTMSSTNKTAGDISSFAGGKTTQKLNFSLMPSGLDVIEQYFEAYRWIVESDEIRNFYNKYESNPSYFLFNDHKLIDYFRTLPILTFVALSGTRDIDVVIRFVRFLYNVSRKVSVAKDIGTQLPIAIRLFVEYVKGTSDYDVCDLISYQKGRTTLLDEEEVKKLDILKRQDSVDKRADVERLFWEAEDHFIFNGEIALFLNCYFSSNKDDLVGFNDSLNVIKHVFIKRYQANNAAATRALLYYANTWFQDSPYYYSNYDCQYWSGIVRSKDKGAYFMQFVQDLHGKSLMHIDTLIKTKILTYFSSNGLTSIEALKKVVSLFDQVRVLAGIDYYTGKTLWQYNLSYIAQDERYPWSDHIPFFNHDRIIYNVNRYIGDGRSGKVLTKMATILQDEERLNQVLGEILDFDPSAALPEQ